MSSSLWGTYPTGIGSTSPKRLTVAHTMNVWTAFTVRTEIAAHVGLDSDLPTERLNVWLKRPGVRIRDQNCSHANQTPNWAPDGRSVIGYNR
jgi:hypothetical protein